MQLSNASVESYADGVLTLAFAKAGTARGFETGGYDQDLSHVLAAMFGKSPQIRTTLVAGGGLAGSGPAGSSRSDVAAGPVPSSSQPPHQGEQAGGGRRDNRDDTGGERPGAGGASQSRSASRSRAAAGKRQDYPPSQASAAAGGDPQPSDLPAPDVLTGTDLIERELGGRIIQELDGS